MGKDRAVKSKVAIVMGSDSDWEVMKPAAEILKDFGVRFEVHVVSAHRTPQKMIQFAQKASGQGLEVLIAGAGGAAHLPGMIASATTLPVIGVPVNITPLKGLDALLSVVQMPKGVPVATMAVDNSFNAGLLAVRILALRSKPLQKKLAAFTTAQKQKVQKMNTRLKAELLALAGASAPQGK